RGQLAEVALAADQVAEPPEPEARALLDQYIRAFETSDAVALKRLLRRDATLELPPSAAWFAGGRAVAEAVRGLRAPGDRPGPPRAGSAPRAGAGEHPAPDCSDPH